MSYFPALRPGVKYLIEHHENHSSIAVGTANFGIKLSGHSAILFIQKANGQKALADILSEIGISNSQALEILQPLLTHNLLSLLTSPSLNSDKEIIDVATKVSLNRCEAELNTLAWRNTSAPVRELGSRADKAIIILGGNRLAFALFELFISIGFHNCQIVEELNAGSKLSGNVAPELVGGTPFRMSDIGQPIKSSIDRIIREYSLNLTGISVNGVTNKRKENSPNELKSLSTVVQPDNETKVKPLIISTTDLLPDQLLNLTIDGNVHLQIGSLSAGKVEIGPIVYPGKTPCYNCISLWKSEKSSEIRNLKVAHTVAPPLELPAASVTYLAGLVVSLIDSYFAINKSFLIGSSLVINLLKPLEYLERFWQPNPKCGCLELL